MDLGWRVVLAGALRAGGPCKRSAPIQITDRLPDASLQASPGSSANPDEPDTPAETRYGDGVDVKRAADLYAEGWTLRQIGAELGVHWSTVSQQLQKAGITMRRGAPAHPASTQEIVELRDQGLTWNEVAQQVDMTTSGAWSRYRRARPPRPPRLGRWQQVLTDALDQNLAIWRPCSRR